MNELALLERKTRLWHIEKAANNISKYIAGRDLEQFLSDSMLQAAVELTSTITDVSGIIACRNQLVHNYPRISPERIWDIISNDLPVLLREVRALLAGENPA